ncbi:hypothetical protein MesoLj131b_28790 [Mesorhizobium sp. 131-2-5]|nr:hypothetical protein MesoLj131b_28790 [Mesorhizobium sp. 131-2-5]
MVIALSPSLILFLARLYALAAMLRRTPRRLKPASLLAPSALLFSLCFWSDPLNLWERPRPVAGLPQCHGLRHMMPEFDGHKTAAHGADARVCTGSSGGGMVDLGFVAEGSRPGNAK